MLKTFLFVLALSLGTCAFGESGADALINSLGGDGKASTASDGTQGIKLKDPFLVQFFSLWQAEEKLPFEVNRWALTILQEKHADAAHLWTVIQPDLPASFQITAKGAYAYLLWKLDAPQTFFNTWMDFLKDKKFSESRISMALDQTLAPTFHEWFFEHAIHVSPDQHKFIASLPMEKGPHVTTLKAWIALRQGKSGEPLLERMTAAHPLKLPLSQTVMLAYAREGDIKSAAGILKRHTEPSVEASGDAEKLASHYLHVARLLYQAGALEGSETFYERVPSDSEDFLRAREETLWVFLRLGKLSELRGELATLTSKALQDHFQPEAFVVRAISNLKLCFYDKVEKDLKDFVEVNRSWAKAIQNALGDESIARPKHPDQFSKLAELSLKSQRQETAKLEQLAKESIGATLPAVGPQRHWSQSLARLAKVTELTKKQRDQEYRRQWESQQYLLKEAIRKMQFVKIEFMSQVRKLSKGKIPSAMDDSAKRLTTIRTAELNAKDADMVFPVDNVVWADELFRMRGVAQAQCLKGSQ